jgi:hypothetical protein
LVEVNAIEKIVAGTNLLTGREANEKAVKAMSRNGELAELSAIVFSG